MGMHDFLYQGIRKYAAGPNRGADWRSPSESFLDPGQTVTNDGGSFTPYGPRAQRQEKIEAQEDMAKFGENKAIAERNERERLADQQMRARIASNLYPGVNATLMRQLQANGTKPQQFGPTKARAAEMDRQEKLAQRVAEIAEDRRRARFIESFYPGVNAALMRQLQADGLISTKPQQLGPTKERAQELAKQEELEEAKAKKSVAYAKLQEDLAKTKRELEHQGRYGSYLGLGIGGGAVLGGGLGAYLAKKNRVLGAILGGGAGATLGGLAGHYAHKSMMA